MNVTSLGQPEQEKSSWTRFGFGFEGQSSSSPSTHQARVFFLRLLAEKRPRVTVSLFEAAYDHLAAYVNSRQDDLALIKERIEPTLAASESAIRILLHGWPAIQRPSGANVSNRLWEWAREWNLIDEWCLDQGLLTLREQLISCLAGGLTHHRFTLESWENALYLGGSSEAIFAQHDINQDLGLSDFKFAHDLIDEIRVEGPFFKSVPEFRREVIQRFEVAGGRDVKGLRKSLFIELDSYLKRFHAQANSLGLTKTRVRWKDGNHFDWLIDYQCPPCRGFRTIAGAIHKDEKTVREAIQSVARRLGLTIRSSQPERQMGRPKGAKDKTPRRRTTKSAGKF